VATPTTVLLPPATVSTATPRKEPSRRGQGRRHRNSVWLYIVVMALMILFGIPFVWIVLTALKTPAELAMGQDQILPAVAQWHNFSQAVTAINFPAYAGNSFFLATLTSVLTTISSSIVGFGFARLRGPGKKVLFLILISTMMLPAILTLIPTYVMFSRVGLVGTYWPWVLWGLAGSPYLIFLFRQFFAAIPAELEDAAIIDGCGYGRIYARIFLPLSRPIIMTSLLLSFTWTWGDYLAPSLLLNINNTTLAVAITSGYLDPHGNGLVTVQAAAAVLYLVPVMVIFLFAQRYFVSSAVGSGVKG